MPTKPRDHREVAKYWPYADCRAKHWRIKLRRHQKVRDALSGKMTRWEREKVVDGWQPHMSPYVSFLGPRGRLMYTLFAKVEVVEEVGNPRQSTSEVRTFLVKGISQPTEDQPAWFQEAIRQLANDVELKRIVNNRVASLDHQAIELNKKWHRQLEAWKKERDLALAEGREPPPRPPPIPGMRPATSHGRRMDEFRVLGKLRRSQKKTEPLEPHEDLGDHEEHQDHP